MVSSISGVLGGSQQVYSLPLFFCISLTPVGEASGGAGACPAKNVRL